MTRSVTVVIQAYNCEDEIDVCPRSVCAQTCPPANVIVVNDASPNGAAERLADWQRQGLTVLAREIPGAGGHATHNLCVRAVRTPWVAFLHADDVGEPDHLGGLSRAGWTRIPT